MRRRFYRHEGGGSVEQVLASEERSSDRPLTLPGARYCPDRIRQRLLLLDWVLSSFPDKHWVPRERQ